MKSNQRFLAAMMALAILTVAPVGRAAEPTVLKFNAGFPPDLAPVWVAIEKGYFKEQGVNVESRRSGAESAASAAALLVSGEMDLVAAALPNVAAARAQGINLKIVAGLTTNGGKGDDSMALVGRKDGPSTLKELAKPGTVIGVSGGKGSPSYVGTRFSIDQTGGDSSLPTYQAVPYPQAQEMILNGSVAASALLQPFLGSALANPEFKLLFYINELKKPDSPSLSLVATAKFADANPEVVKKLQAGIAKAIKWIGDPTNRSEYMAIVARNNGQKLSVLERTPLPQFSQTFSREAADELMRINLKYGGIPSLPNLDDLVVSGVMQ